jgi:hypothetical protein
MGQMMGARQLVGDQHPRSVPETISQAAKEGEYSLRVASLLDEDIEDDAVLVDSSP